ncbi:hypothetical protein ACF07Y_36930 [Streptomyces sp. NPDC016566]
MGVVPGFVQAPVSSLEGKNCRNRGVLRSLVATLIGTLLREVMARLAAT